MKKIGLVMRELNYGGAERAICRLSHILNEDFIVYMILFNGEVIKYDYKGELIDLNIEIGKNLLQKVIALIKRVIKLKKVKKELDLDICISYLDGANIINILSRNKEKVIVSIRNYKTAQTNNSLVDRIQGKLIKILYNRADTVVAVSQIIRNELINSFGIYSNKVKVIYNPYDLNEITKLMFEENNEIQKEFFENREVVISVGRIMRQKGFWNLIKAIYLLKEEIPNIGLVIIGEAMDIELKDKLDSLIEKYNLQENIFFAGYQKNPFSYMRYAKCYVMTSLFEGFPNSLVEAMACGLPIISVDCKSGPREILYEKPILDEEINDITFADYGILVPQINSNDINNLDLITDEHIKLSTAIKILINSEKKREQYKEKSLERAKDFNYDRCKKEYLGIF